jgi:hypothetical protein
MGAPTSMFPEVPRRDLLRCGSEETKVGAAVDGHAVRRRSHEGRDLFRRGLKHGFTIVRRSPAVIGELGIMVPGSVSYGRLTGRIVCGPAAGELGTRRWRVEAWVSHAPPSDMFCHSTRTGAVNVTAGHAKGRHKASKQRGRQVGIATPPPQPLCTTRLQASPIAKCK